MSPVVLKAVVEKMDSLKQSAVLTPKVETEVSSDEPSEEYGSSTPSWESDHNYIAVKPEKTAAISSTLFYKCMYHLGVLPHSTHSSNYLRTHICCLQYTALFPINLG